ncbi:MAG TPA: transposase [Thermoanaerobaculia bacterium]|nr:transposase [Thermoanaerobaculia bacterium]
MTEKAAPNPARRPDPSSLVSPGHRRSLRLPSWDYRGGGAYFLTLCTAGRECLLGDVVESGVRLTEIGTLVEEEWRRSGALRSELELDAFVIMPNHLHGIVWLTEIVGAHGRAPSGVSATPDARSVPFQRPPRSLGSFVAGFKSATTLRVNVLRDSRGVPFWQRNYFERVIRHDEELHRVREYIAENPLKWHLDPERPGR